MPDEQIENRAAEKVWQGDRPETVSSTILTEPVCLVEQLQGLCAAVMKVTSSQDYEKCMRVAKDAMAPYYLENKLHWDDQARLEISRECELYMLEDDSEVGCFMLRKRDDRIFLADLQILEKYRNLGYGTKVLEIVREKARAKGFASIWLKVFKTSPAYGLYLRNGYVVQDEEEFMYVMSANT